MKKIFDYTKSRWGKYFSKNGKEKLDALPKRNLDMNTNFAPPMSRSEMIQHLIETGEFRRVLKNQAYVEEMLEEAEDFSVHDPNGLATLYEDKIRPHLKRRHLNEDPVQPEDIPSGLGQLKKSSPKATKVKEGAAPSEGSEGDPKG